MDTFNMETSKPIQKWYRHTEKAVARGEPKDRLFAAIRRNGDYVLAWKHTLMPNGTIRHGGYSGNGACMRADDPRLFSEASPEGGTPTAFFKPDSLYRHINKKRLLQP